MATFNDLVRGATATYFTPNTERDPAMQRLDEMLNALPDKLQRRVLGRAMRAGGVVFQRLAVQRLSTHRKTGTLAGSIRVRLSRRRGVTNVLVRAGGKGKWGDAYYAHMIEFGAKRHLIKPKNRKSLLFARLMREVVEHPGFEEIPYMRPAFDTGVQEAIDEIAKVVRAGIETEARKAAR